MQLKRPPESKTTVIEFITKHGFLKTETLQTATSSDCYHIAVVLSVLTGIDQTALSDTIRFNDLVTIGPNEDIPSDYGIYLDIAYREVINHLNTFHRLASFSREVRRIDNQLLKVEITDRKTGDLLWADLRNMVLLSNPELRVINHGGVEYVNDSCYGSRFLAVTKVEDELRLSGPAIELNIEDDNWELTVAGNTYVFKPYEQKLELPIRFKIIENEGC